MTTPLPSRPPESVREPEFHADAANAGTVARAAAFRADGTAEREWLAAGKAAGVAAEQCRTETVTRFEVIDHRAATMAADAGARAFVAYRVSVELSYQDDGTTLKAFLRDRPEGGEHHAADRLAERASRIDLGDDPDGDNS